MELLEIKAECIWRRHNRSKRYCNIVAYLNFRCDFFADRSDELPYFFLFFLTKTVASNYISFHESFPELIAAIYFFYPLKLLYFFTSETDKPSILVQNPDNFMKKSSLIIRVVKVKYFTCYFMLLILLSLVTLNMLEKL